MAATRLCILAFIMAVCATSDQPLLRIRCRRRHLLGGAHLNACTLLRHPGGDAAKNRNRRGMRAEIGVRNALGTYKMCRGTIRARKLLE